jgi:tricorn protease
MLPMFLRISRLLPALVVAVFALPAAGQEPIRMARTPDISPDGKLVAFSYLGDIYTVETIGGTARAVTSHPAHDIFPAFSPDGRFLAFSSNRHGNYDVFVVPVRGGRPKRLTFDSANDLVCGWSPDGKQILFASTRSVAYPPSWELYTVPVEGGRVRRVSAAEGKDGVYSNKGDLIAYVRGQGSWYRKGYRGSSNDDVWVCNADGTGNRRLTHFEGQDGSPMWSPDGNTIYYVSEFFGTANIVRKPVSAGLDKTAGPGKPAQVTFHKDESVRRARISRDGSYIVYECGADLWVVGTGDDSRPRKLAIEVNADDKVNPERVFPFTRGATEFAVSGDEKFVAFAVHGKLFRMPVGFSSKVTQMTDGPSNDHGMAWAPDGSKMIFVSDRNGYDDLYLLEPDDPEHKKFTEAHRFKVTRLTSTKEPEHGVSFAPDGKLVAFIRAGRLWTMKPDGKDQKVLVKDPEVFDYEWSPDGRWIVYARRDGSFASELYIIQSSGPTVSRPVRNVTRYATYNGGVTWSADGKRLAFLTDRRGSGNLYVMDLQKPAAGETPSRPSWGGSSRTPVAIDWEDVHLRVKSVVPAYVNEAAISPDGSKVAFRDSYFNDLWVASTTGGQLTRLTTGGQQPRQIQWSKKRSFGSSVDIVYFLDGAGNLRMGRGGGGEAKPGSPNSNTVVMPFKIKMTIKTEELYREMFDQSWRYLAEHFYDRTFHGRNWEEVRARYRPLVKHVALKEDLYSLLYLMMGELNASHLGVSGFFPGPEEETAELGLLFDDTYKGKGLKIAEILKRGPADKRGVALQAGEVITAIDGVEVGDNFNLSKALNGKVDEPVMLQVIDPAKPKLKPRRVELKGMNRHRDARHRTTSVSDLMYDRWVAGNAKKVAELSKEKLGYIHIPSMDEEGLDRFVRSLYSDNYDKEAIVLDVRFNGGGYTHDMVLNYLGRREHTVFKHREGGQGGVLRSWDRKWTKPLVLLINNRSYSDAEILPSAVRTLGLGKLVGEPTGGFVIGTSAVRLIDGSVFRVPRIGVFTTKGVNMEKEGVKPDVQVETHPDQLARGQDVQLDKAVEVLRNDVEARKKKGGPAVTSKPPAGAPAPAPKGGPK